MTKLDAGLITPLPASDSGSVAAQCSKRINPRPQFCLCLTWSGYLFKRRRRRGLKFTDKLTILFIEICLRLKMLFLFDLKWMLETLYFKL